MTDHLQAVVDHVMSDDDGELAKTKAELAYALFSLERELAIAQQAQRDLSHAKAMQEVWMNRAQKAEDALHEINRIVHVPTKRTKYSTPVEHYQADFDAIRKLTSALPSKEQK